MKPLALVLALATTATIAGEVRTFECKRPVCVMVSEADLDTMIAANNENHERAEKLEKRVRELESGAPKCAKLEVVEPPKKIPIDPKTNRPS